MACFHLRTQAGLAHWPSEGLGPAGQLGVRAGVLGDEVGWGSGGGSGSAFLCPLSLERPGVEGVSVHAVVQPQSSGKCSRGTGFFRDLDGW